MRFILVVAPIQKHHVNQLAGTGISANLPLPATVLNSDMNNVPPALKSPSDKAQTSTISTASCSLGILVDVIGSRSFRRVINDGATYPGGKVCYSCADSISMI